VARANNLESWRFAGVVRGVRRGVQVCAESVWDVRGESAGGVRGFVWVRIDARLGMRRLPDPNGPIEPWVVRGRTSTLGGHAVVDLTGDGV
jgi:hypothetical protein